MAITLNGGSQDLFVVNYDGQYGKYYEFRAQAREDNISAANNNGLVTVDVLMRRPDGSSSGAWNQNGTYWSITIDEETFSGSAKWDTRNTSEWQYLGYAQKWITHDNDGNKTITISAYHEGNSASGSSKMGNASGSATVNLQTIPRYTTVYNSVRSRGLNNVSINWSTTDESNYTQYSLNGGGWQDAHDIVASDHKSGYYTISELSPNTTYTIKTRSRRADSGLWSESGSISVTTYDIARISSRTDFELGDNVKINYDNPSGSSLEIGLYNTDGNTGYAPYRSCSGSSYTFDFTDSELDSIYKALGATNAKTFKVYIRTAGVVSYTDAREVTVTLTGNQKTGHTNVNGAWKRTKRWVNVNGTWKRCVRWVNVNGTWRRCI